MPANLGDMSWGMTGVPALPSALRLMAIIIQNSALWNERLLLMRIIKKAPPHMDRVCREKWKYDLFICFALDLDLVFSFNTEIKLPWVPEFCFLHHVQIERKAATTRSNERFKAMVFFGSHLQIFRTALRL